MAEREEGVPAEVDPLSEKNHASQAGSEQVDQLSENVERPLAEVNPLVGGRRAVIERSRRSPSFCVNTVRVVKQVIEQPWKGAAFGLGTDLIQYRRWIGTIVERRGGSKKLKTGRAHPLVQRGRRQAFVRPRKLNSEVISKCLHMYKGLRGKSFPRIVF